MSDHVRIFCLRHAEADTTFGGGGRVNPAAPLTPRGRDQAASAAATFRGVAVDGVYDSTAVRSRDTAAAVARVVGADPVPMPGLLEADVDAATLRAWIVDRDLSARAEDGETGADVAARVTAALTAIADRHPGGTVAVVGHVASLTVGLSELCGLGGTVWGRPLPHAVPFLVERRGDTWTCTSWPGP
ncbi:histidine phosphatase family protein [Longispora sp. NPDC051575]|uniref:histidine phosphatase family protein n=1 Tax=Longispora sp. NPDC051575 TaxID=3154943 RepID=UPI003427E5B1